MPRFEITGADRDTGFEQTLRLDAKNEHEARAMAVMKLLSIAKIRRVELEDEVAKSLEGSAPQPGGKEASIGELVQPAQKEICVQSVSQKVKYEEIVTGAKVLRTLAGVCDVIGGLVIVTGVIGGVIVISHEQVVLAITVVFGGALLGFFYFALGAILAMLAGLGHAVRDIAIMSLREK